MYYEVHKYRFYSEKYDLNHLLFQDWDASRSVAKLIYKEFFTQGDLEKAMGNLPLVMMDRDKAFIPELQLSFLDNIALPVYKWVDTVTLETKCFFLWN